MKPSHCQCFGSIPSLAPAACGFGFADLEKKTPVTAETKFRIGSVTKQFTAAAVLRLARQIFRFEVLRGLE
jgi:hypothetical protein